MRPEQFVSSTCGDLRYPKDHEWGEFVEHEERGVLVITHGKRVGRIYATERTWTERACEKCNDKEVHETGQHSSQWPSGV